MKWWLLLAAVLVVGALCFYLIFFALPWIGAKTTYAPGFSEQAFKQIRAGMTEGEVIALVGEPLGKWVRERSPLQKEKEITLYYTQPDPRGNECYHRRFVTFNESGRVCEVTSDRWYD